MMGKIVTAACFVFILGLVVSCATTSIPPALLVCRDEPVYGGRSNVTTADVVEFADQLAVAGADCRARLKAVKKIVSP